ncbi:MAG TPA: hypothetical protein VKH45_09705 [Candidatus Acidoferrum sp.]|nr:hypothetical protein [Candidatus Acidoferrum sp.]
MKAYDALGLSSNDPNTIPDANATMIVNSVSIYASAFFSQIVANLAKSTGIDATQLLSMLAQKFLEPAAAAANFLTQAGYSFSSWISSVETVLGINLDFSCIIEFVNSGPYTLTLTNSAIIYGGYLIPPPPTIGPEQTIRFWLKDPKPSIHGAQGWVSYTYTDSNNQIHAVTFNYDCPTGFFSNTVSITPGSPFNFYAQSGNYSPGGWGRLNSVPGSGHPLYVAFIWGINPPPA